MSQINVVKDDNVKILCPHCGSDIEEIIVKNAGGRIFV